jgi:hypothetical protein
LLPADPNNFDRIMASTIEDNDSCPLCGLTTDPSRYTHMGVSFDKAPAVVQKMVKTEVACADGLHIASCGRRYLSC